MRNKSTVEVLIKQVMAAAEGCKIDVLPEDKERLVYCHGALAVLNSILREYVKREVDLPGCIIEKCSGEIVDIIEFINKCKQRKDYANEKAV